MQRVYAYNSNYKGYDKENWESGNNYELHEYATNELKKAKKNGLLQQQCCVVCGKKEKVFAQISRSLKILEESGFIDIITGKNKKGARISNEYRFHQWDKGCCLNKAPHTQISSMGNS